MISCDGCYALFVDTHGDEKLADNLQNAKPDGTCETCSVSSVGRGPVTDDESLFRLAVDPRDFDEGNLAERPFRSVFTSGLSVARSISTDDELIDLLEDGMVHRADREPSQIMYICELSVREIRKMCDESGKRMFFVYNQTVPRISSDGPEIGSHAGVFQLSPPANTENRNNLCKDMAGTLKKEFEKNVHPVAKFRNGVLLQSNQKALDGYFAQVE